jgi:hypothetical protein
LSLQIEYDTWMKETIRKNRRMAGNRTKIPYFILKVNTRLKENQKCSSWNHCKKR